MKSQFATSNCVKDYCFRKIIVDFSSTSQVVNSATYLPASQSLSFSGVKITGIRFLLLFISAIKGFASVVTTV